ncbi:unnamed protein product, partial [Effrenium voratum]
TLVEMDPTLSLSEQMRSELMLELANISHQEILVIRYPEWEEGEPMNPHEEAEDEGFGHTVDGGVDKTPMTDPEEVPDYGEFEEIGDEGEATALNAMEELDAESSDPLSVGEAIQLQLAANAAFGKAKGKGGKGVEGTATGPVTLIANFRAQKGKVTSLLDQHLWFMTDQDAVTRNNRARIVVREGEMDEDLEGEELAAADLHIILQDCVVEVTQGGEPASPPWEAVAYHGMDDEMKPDTVSVQNFPVVDIYAEDEEDVWGALDEGCNSTVHSSYWADEMEKRLRYNRVPELVCDTGTVVFSVGLRWDFANHEMMKMERDHDVVMEILPENRRSLPTVMLDCRGIHDPDCGRYRGATLFGAMLCRMAEDNWRIVHYHSDSWRRMDCGGHCEMCNMTEANANNLIEMVESSFPKEQRNAPKPAAPRVSTPKPMLMKIQSKAKPQSVAKENPVKVPAVEEKNREMEQLKAKVSRLAGMVKGLVEERDKACEPIHIVENVGVGQCAMKKVRQP